jgi:hydrogenase-4 component F
MTWPVAATGTVSVPLLAAAGLAALPSRRVAWVSVAGAAAALGCAAFLPWTTAKPGDALLTDGLAAHLAILAGLVGLITAWADRHAARRRPAVLPLQLGLVQLALLSDDIGLAWTAFAAAAMLTAGWRAGPGLLPTAAGVLLALFGAVLLHIAAVPTLDPGWPGLRWTSLAAAAPGCPGGVLSLAFLLLLAGYGAVAVLAPRHAGPGGAAAGVLLPIVAFSVVLRLRGVVAANPDAVAPGPPLLAFGMGALLLGALGVWRRGRLTAASTLCHNGIAAVAFGLGGPAATFAGLLHLTAHSLAHAALRRSLPAMPLAILLVALAGLPPFALFGSEALILTEAARSLPWLALLFGLGLLALAGALAVRLRERPGPAAEPSGAAFAWTWLPVAALLGLGAAMPAGVAAWFWAVAAAP